MIALIDGKVPTKEIDGLTLRIMRREEALPEISVSEDLMQLKFMQQQVDHRKTFGPSKKPTLELIDDLTRTLDCRELCQEMFGFAFGSARHLPLASSVEVFRP